MANKTKLVFFFLVLGAALFASHLNADHEFIASLREKGKRGDSITDSELSRLKFGPDIDASIYAAWIQTCKVHGVDSLAADDVRSSESVTRENRMQFLGFVSARINGPIPEWWQRGIVTSRRGFAPVPGIDEIRRLYPVVIKHDIRHTEELNVQPFDLEEGILPIKYKEKLWNIHLFKIVGDQGIPQVVDVHSSQGETLFAVIAREGDRLCFECYDNESDEAAWTGFVDLVRYGSVSGRLEDFWPGRLEIQQINGKWHIFGATQWSMFLEVLDRNGRSILSFTTAF